ncbi:MAG: hypothetical protein PHE63_00320 [Eubacteriales bacterium]|nr:hypothetical protein [Eubacteriales bacterium]
MKSYLTLEPLLYTEYPDETEWLVNRAAFLYDTEKDNYRYFLNSGLIQELQMIEKIYRYEANEGFWLHFWRYEENYDG